ncbi:Protein kinase-like domain [Pseudocohnilembus persalinus]|uniref:Protein kinase-like domain n=1 Tax=Pseudocohnilembus persalinus TaxID=266149 RepID=A0A0V0QHC2_PSEPJ|nr:Protein kinase-like domain [Pseudocohnilembus persalinus]|eukprot:KRX01572.1 Protein kinase-like domain [Pseudocohnilembus persalinus]
MEEKMFYLQNKADFYRYLAEISNGAVFNNAANQALNNYKQCFELSEQFLQSNDYFRLGVGLNYSVFCYEIMNQKEKALEICQKMIDAYQKNMSRGSMQANFAQNYIMSDKVIENYILNEIVGSGSYGKVYKARNMKNDEIVAVKVIPLQKFKEVPKLSEFTMNEIQTLSKIDNQHVVKFLEMLKTTNNMYLVYEFCNGQTLEDEIKKKNFLSEEQSLCYLSQMLFAFRPLAQKNILHRDLKPSNILFQDGVLKIADFGFCKSLETQKDMTQTMVGSPIYMAPEILKGQSYNTKADIWSLGVVFFECLFGFCPFEESSIAKLINVIDNKQLKIPRHINNISKNTEDLLRAMLVLDQKKRIDWPQLFQLIQFDDQIQDFQREQPQFQQESSQIKSQKRAKFE